MQVAVPHSLARQAKRQKENELASQWNTNNPLSLFLFGTRASDKMRCRETHVLEAVRWVQQKHGREIAVISNHAYPTQREIYASSR